MFCMKIYKAKYKICDSEHKLPCIVDGVHYFTDWYYFDGIWCD